LDGIKAPFESVTLKRGERSKPIRLEMLYAKRDGSWELRWVKAMHVGTDNYEKERKMGSE
jgi:hypothetical protein